MARQAAHDRPRTEKDASGKKRRRQTPADEKADSREEVIENGTAVANTIAGSPAVKAANNSGNITPRRTRSTITPKEDTKPTGVRATADGVPPVVPEPSAGLEPPHLKVDAPLTTADRGPPVVPEPSPALEPPDLKVDAPSTNQSCGSTAQCAFDITNLRTIVISLDRRPDRMQECADRLRQHCHGLNFERFDASDGKRDEISDTSCTRSWHTAKNVVYQKKRSMRKGWDDLASYAERSLQHSPGERGCSMSHIRAWRLCLENASVAVEAACASGASEDQRRRAAEQPLLVLEDDAAPTPEFVDRLQRAMEALPQDADVLYLGYSQAADWRREVTSELVESEYVWTTVGYIVWPAGARKLLSALPVDQPVDNFMATLNAEGDLKAYCVRPKIIRQSDAWNVNSDVGHSDEQYWGPSSDILHSDAFYWGSDIAQSQFISGSDTASTAPSSSTISQSQTIW